MALENLAFGVWNEKRDTQTIANNRNDQDEVWLKAYIENYSITNMYCISELVAYEHEANDYHD